MRSLFFALAFVAVPIAEVAAKECTAEQHDADQRIDHPAARRAVQQPLQCDRCQQKDTGGGEGKLARWARQGDIWSPLRRLKAVSLAGATARGGEGEDAARHR